MSDHILLEVDAIAPSPTNPRRIFPDAYDPADRSAMLLLTGFVLPEVRRG